MTRPRLLLPLTLLVMLAGTMPVFTLAVLAPSLAQELGLGPGRFGVVSSALFLAAAVAAPRAGRLVDAVGPRRGVLAVALLTIVAHVAVAVARDTTMLLVAAAAGGLANAVTNPVTNQLVAAGAAPHRRGLFVGVKQSGVPAAAVVAGVMLPPVAAVDWRLAALTPIGVGLLVAAGALLVPAPAGRQVGDGRFTRTRPLWLLRWYMGLMGGASGLVNTFLVLFAVDAVGLTHGRAGLAAAVMGGAAVVARIAWAHVSARTGGTVLMLAVTAGLGVVSGVMLLGAVGSWPGAVWPASLVAGLGVIAWHGVGMLAVLERVSADTVGAASGYVVRGFFIGLLVTPVLFGAVVDVTGSYVLLWVAQAALCMAAAVPAVALRRERQAARHPAA